MVDQNYPDHFESEHIQEWKIHYNQLVDKETVATAWMENPTTTYTQKMKQFARYKIEILDAMAGYIELLKSIGIEAKPFEKINAD